MVTKQNFLLCLLLASIVSACCWGVKGFGINYQFGSTVEISNPKNSYQLHDTIWVGIKIPTQLYDSLRKETVNYQGRDIFLRVTIIDSLGNHTQNIAVSSGFGKLIEIGTQKDFSIAGVIYQGILLANKPDSYDLRVGYITRKYQKLGLHFSLFVPKPVFVDDCGGKSYDVILLKTNLNKNFNASFLDKNQTFKIPYNYENEKETYFFFEVVP